jgi:hypothetical protein
MKTFTNVDDGVLIEAIASARNRLVYVAPGISEAVAHALRAKIDDIPRERVVIVLDVDPEVCRMGYGDIQGLECVQKAADEWEITLDHQPGIRIGLLIADEQTLVYTPTPLLIEAGPASPRRPNAIRMDARETPALMEACGASGSIERREVGMDPVRPTTVEAVKQNLALNPPKKFDVSRAERVFNSAMQYVDFHFTGFRLSKKEMPIPADLMGLANDSDLKDRWKNSFRLFGSNEGVEVRLPLRDKDDRILKDIHGKDQTEVYTERTLEREKLDIVRQFVVVVPRFGSFILRNRRPDFDARIKRFEKRVDEFRQALEQQLVDQLEVSKNRLIEYLVPKVVENPPDSWMSTMTGSEVTDAEATERLNAMLSPDFSSADQVFQPKVEVKYMDISYETIKNQNFLAAARTEFAKRGATATFDRLFSEHDAAPETGPRQGMLPFM